ncbi:ubiquinone/menaquinone biosynthesis C-methylase UbiE [Stackebrandtia endophytica]|uniref:Ubiquinone/menaquinone biosynthesis C-methylase UbiE n=1 Tax=Stackebrandtia endophytica TaxID=1496996 RepID=A0A543B423_9ACTN|nr:class I SAM-dependent methyltransferase [Stackebrandtia endophytica]TQL79562.1 ubiquinone/menaquinone biosynthesis C-methylase UbiE [Stackebrandtia endophytica]
MRDYRALVDEAASVSVDGWDFSWLAGRADEQRPSWGYASAMAERLSTANRALDVDTGGGEVLNEAADLPALTVATESWPPNLARAAESLSPRGVNLVRTRDASALPFRDAVFDLVTSRHPVKVWWHEIARVLAPGGTYFAQHVGPASAVEVTEWFLGPQPDAWEHRRPETDRAEAEAAGLSIIDLRCERLRMEFFDVGAMIYFLRKVIWILPEFTVERYEHRLRALHDHIVANGSFVAHSSRFLIEGAKPQR